MPEDKTICPHCGEKMSLWRPPIETNWGDHPQYVCFNDNCPYYIKGWDWMKSQYDQKVSYRHRYDPEADQSGPLPVWSVNALKNSIVDESEADGTQEKKLETRFKNLSKKFSKIIRA